MTKQALIRLHFLEDWTSIMLDTMLKNTVIVPENADPFFPVQEATRILLMIQMTLTRTNPRTVTWEEYVYFSVSCYTCNSLHSTIFHHGT